MSGDLKTILLAAVLTLSGVNLAPALAEDAPKPPADDAKLPVPPHGADGEGHVCFRASADEIDKWRARVEQQGVAIEADFEWPDGGRSIYFRDPAGNCLEFAEPRIWGFK